MQEWYYKKDDRIVGPVSRQELDYLATEQRIRSATEVRKGDSGEWIRYRAGRNSQPTAVTPVACTKQTETVEPKPSPAGPPKLEQTRDVTRRQAIIGSILAVLLLVLLWFLWSQLPGGSPSGSPNASGQGLASNDSTTTSGTGAAEEGDQPIASTASQDGQSSSASDDGLEQSQEGEPLDNSGNGSKETATAGSADTEADQSTASAVPDNDAAKDEDLATQTADGMDSIQAGDPLSKFTISAPGEAVFFGLRATGTRFAFVVDRSGSMDGLPMRRARKELMNCIRQMPKHVEVFVVFFDDLAYPDDGKYRGVDTQNIEELDDWVSSIRANGGTDVKVGMRTVFNEGEPPDAIFLLTDGNFDADTPDYVKKMNKRSNVRINTVALVSRAGEYLLKQIAAENDGDYRFVP